MSPFHPVLTSMISVICCAVSPSPHRPQEGQCARPYAPTIVSVLLPTGSETMDPKDYSLKPLNSGARLRLSSFKLISSSILHSNK